MNVRRIDPHWLIGSLALLLPFAMLLALALGSSHFSSQQLWQGLTGEAGHIATIVWQIRLPRVLLAAGVGAVLALCGAVMQGLFRNPLADPSLIGVSSGASVGASVAIVLASGWLPSLLGLPLTAAAAFAGGLVATLLVYHLATSATGTSVATMLLAGIAITALAGAGGGLLSYFADNATLRRITLWQMGSLSGATFERAVLMVVLALVLALWLPRFARALNALLLGESEARHLGIAVQRVKRTLIVLTALGVGSAVAAAGMVAFVGLVVPHMVRLLAGPDHRYLLPASALGGALLLVAADTLARTIIAPVELPTGIITALLGAPFFVTLLYQQRSRI